VSGYTPVFGSVVDGTLCGQWPDLGVWVVLLAISDRNGLVDMTPQRIAAVLGIPVPDLTACLERLCAPDPFSRTKSEQGKRLQLIDPDRPWGWRIVNHAAYRERARKQAYDSERTVSGRDSERKRLSRDVPRSPATSRSPNSDSNSDSDKKGIRGAPAVLPDGVDPSSWADWLAYRRERNLPRSSRALSLHAKSLVPYPPEVQRAMIEQAIANDWRGIFPLKGNGAVHKAMQAENNRKALDAWVAQGDEHDAT